MEIDDFKKLKEAYKQELTNRNYERALELNRQLYDEIFKVCLETQRNEFDISFLKLELKLLERSAMAIEEILTIDSRKSNQIREIKELG